MQSQAGGPEKEVSLGLGDIAKIRGNKNGKSARAGWESTYPAEIHTGDQYRFLGVVICGMIIFSNCLAAIFILFSDYFVLVVYWTTDCVFLSVLVGFEFLF
jgi:hypothetical protein